MKEDIIIHYFINEEELNTVKEWLAQNIPHHETKWNGFVGWDEHGEYIWRMSTVRLLGYSRVLFNNKDAAMLFSLRWT